MPSTSAEIRAWALANGHQVGDRGRLPDVVVQAYGASQRPRGEDPNGGDQRQREQARVATGRAHLGELAERVTAVQDGEQPVRRRGDQALARPGHRRERREPRRRGDRVAAQLLHRHRASLYAAEAAGVFTYKTLGQGAATSLVAAMAPELPGVGGLYLDDCRGAYTLPDEATLAEHPTA